MDGDESNHVTDLTPFLLFESTGDSELDSDRNMAIAGIDMPENVGIDGEDDAQSCSYESSAITPGCLDWFCGKERVMEIARTGDDDDHDGDYDDSFNNAPVVADDDTEESSAVYEDSADSKMVLTTNRTCAPRFVAARNRNKSKLCADPNMEPTSEKEQDRLFWEACLAS